MNIEQAHPKPSLKQFVFYFIKLGYSGFGGPVALVGYIHRDLVEQRKWVTEEEYKEALAFAQLAPGPLAAQVAIYLGFVHARILGATLAILAFCMPSFFMVLGIAIAYKAYGGLPWMQAVFYGISASVIGIISISAYKLSTRSIGKINWSSIRQNIFKWVLFLTAGIITVVTHHENVLLFIAAGLIYMIIKAPPAWIKKPGVTNSVFLIGLGLWEFEWNTLTTIALFFAKAGAFVFGSGLAIVPFLHGGVVIEHEWLTETQFVDAVAVAMITPGPLIMTVGFIGYLVAGLPGAVVATVAVFLPVYVITIIGAPYFNKITKNQSIKAFVEGITAAVMGALTGAVILIAMNAIIDIPTALIASVTMLLLIFFKKIKEPYLILAAAIVGLVLKSWVMN